MSLPNHFALPKRAQGRVAERLPLPPGRVHAETEVHQHRRVAGGAGKREVDVGKHLGDESRFRRPLNLRRKHPGRSGGQILVAIETEEESFRAALPEERNGVARIVAKMQETPHDTTGSRCRLFCEWNGPVLDGDVFEQELVTCLLVLQRHRRCVGERAGSITRTQHNHQRRYRPQLSGTYHQVFKVASGRGAITGGVAASSCSSALSRWR